MKEEIKILLQLLENLKKKYIRNIRGKNFYNIQDIEYNPEFEDVREYLSNSLLLNEMDSLIKQAHSFIEKSENNFIVDETKKHFYIEKGLLSSVIKKKNLLKHKTSISRESIISNKLTGAGSIIENLSGITIQAIEHLPRSYSLPRSKKKRVKQNIETALNDSIAAMEYLIRNVDVPQSYHVSYGLACQAFSIANDSLLNIEEEYDL